MRGRRRGKAEDSQAAHRVKVGNSGGARLYSSHKGRPESTETGQGNEKAGKGKVCGMEPGGG